MTELASGAVSSLLGLLRNEALLLSNVGSDMEFIKEEMESMQSFLEHLARTAHPAGGHDEQVRTWMKQVRDLARDCSNFIELHHRRGDLAVYRARGQRWRRYLWWADWLVHKMVARHSAATRLCELKERARDVGKRRLRYGVEIPRKDAGGPAEAAASMLPLSSWSPRATTALAAAEEDDDDDEEEDKVAEVAATDGSNPRPSALLEEPRPLVEDYCAEKLASWLELQSKTKKVAIASTAIVAPDDAENAGAIAWESLNLAASHFKYKVWINLPELHFPGDLPLLPSEILAYVLRECEIQDLEKLEQDKCKQQQQGKEVQDDNKVEDEKKDPRWQPYQYKQDLDNEIWDISPDIDAKIENIKKKIGGVDVDSSLFKRSSKNLMTSIDKRLGVLLYVLRLLQEADDTGLPLSWDEAMGETARRLKTHMEQEAETKATSTTEQEVKDNPTSKSEQEFKAKPQICLDVTQYKDILKKVFPESNSPQPQAKEASTSTLGEDHIKEIIHNHRITLDIIWKLLPKQQQQQLEGNSGTGSIQHEQGGHDQVANSTAAAAEAVIKQTREKMKDISREGAKAAVTIAIDETKIKLFDIRWEIIDQLRNKGAVDKINTHLKDKKTLIILQDDEDFVSHWEETRYALNLLDCTAGSAVIVSTKNSQKAKEFCNPPGEPVTCSLVGLYYDIVLQLTEQRVNNGNDCCNPQILRDILESCHHEFCMKIFAHALYANPNRSYQELRNLHQDLVAQKTLGNKAKKMIKFSYKELPREYKTCLLYLAIFPQGHNIRRSTLIGRWVTEGLITKQDWRTTVRYAERCFEALIKRGLVLPCDIGTAGKVKSCIVGDQVHGFISKIANNEHILDARLSDQWARHFSIFSGLRLRASDSIDKFVRQLPNYSPQLPLLKVLDLEGVECFDKNQYLKDICNKILLLKYLSLRRTNVTKLPIQINNLHELEVLDIRQTRVPEKATRNVLLLKLRRLLVDCDDSSSGMCAKSCSAVQIPSQINRMENLEVLSTVKATGDGSDLREIRKLWQLRKLGVVIQDNYNHLRRLFQAISDLHECLLSLSVTISPITKTKRVPSREEKLLQDIKTWQNKTRKLESLTINGVTLTEKVQLLESLAKGCDDLAKVTLSGTLLEQDSLTVLAMLPKLRCVRLRSNAYSETKLTFNKEGFPQLKYFLVEDPDMADGKISMTGTGIKFEDGATTELEKIVLSFTNISSLCGIDNLPKLKELQLEANQFLLSFCHDEAAPEQHTESRDDEQNTQSGAPRKNRESGAPGHDTQGRAADQSTENRAAAEKDTQSTDPDAQNTDTRATELGTQSRVPEQNPERNIVPEQYTESRFTFKKDKFQHLVCFHFTDSKRTNIIFETGAAPELRKIILSLDDKRSKLTGVNDLRKLNEVELNGDKFLLTFFLNASHITKMTLRDTHLKQEDIHELGKKQKILRCLVLSDNSYDENQLTFNEFPMLDLLIVKCRNISSISFTNETAAPKLMRILWSFREIKSLDGISNLPNLKEIECSGEHVPYQVRKEIIAHEGKPVLTHKRPPQQSQATGEEGNDKGCPLICF